VEVRLFELHQTRGEPVMTHKVRNARTVRLFALYIFLIEKWFVKWAKDLGWSVIYGKMGNPKSSGVMQE